MTQINIRIDNDLKEKAEKLFEELGLNMSTAFNIFIRQSIREGGIPFRITTRVASFPNEASMKMLQNSLGRVNESEFTCNLLEKLKEDEERTVYFEEEEEKKEK